VRRTAPDDGVGLADGLLDHDAIEALWQRWLEGRRDVGPGPAALLDLGVVEAGHARSPQSQLLLRLPQACHSPGSISATGSKSVLYPFDGHAFRMSATSSSTPARVPVTEYLTSQRV